MMINKVVRMTNVGIELEVVPRHAELVISELGLNNARLEDGVQNCSYNGHTNEAIHSGKMSSKGEKWDNAISNEFEIDDDGDDTELDAERARSYRAIAACLNYISPDRPDIGYAVKESARNMIEPRVSDLQKLRKIGRYLVGKPV